MKSITTDLAALLATGNYVRADLWTIVLNGGSVVRWTSHDRALSYAGQTFAKGPLIEGGATSEKVGLDVATLEVSITALDADLINGAPLIAFIADHGFDGATIKRERAYAANWSSPIVGTVIRFAGKVTAVSSVKGATAALTVSSWLVLLNSASPRNLFQAGCLRTVYDAGCALNPASFSASGTVTVAGQGSFGSGLTGVPGYYSQGRLVFASGPNAGVSRTIKINATDGTFTLIRPLPAIAGVGNTFTAYAGCDLSLATCTTKFSNQLRFRGTPFVPVPTTALGAANTTTTTGGKG